MHWPNSTIDGYVMIVEQYLLANMLLDESSCTDAVSMLSADDFLHATNRKVFEIIKHVHKRGDGVDVILVASEANDKTLKNYVFDLTDKCESLAGTERYCKKIKNDSIVAKIFRIAMETADKAKIGGDANELITETEKALLDLVIDNKTRDFVHVKDTMPEVFDRFESRVVSGKSDGISYSFSKIDEFTGGMHDGDLIILSGRPGMGKTTLCANMALRSEVNLYLFETEMDKITLAENALCAVSKLDSMRFRNGTVNKDEKQRIALGVNDIIQSKYFINDAPYLTPTILRNSVRRQIALHGKGIFAIDSIQNLAVDGRSHGPREDMNAISRSLKLIAKEFSVPIIGISHLTRDVDKRDNKRPVNADLRESGSIESDADVILHLYREAHYNHTFKFKDIAEVGVGKNRHGITRVALLYCDLSTGKFDNLDNDSYNEYTEAIKGEIGG